MILRTLLLVLSIAVSRTISQDVWQSESFGGSHGTEFSDKDSVVGGQTVKSITIRAGECIDGVSMEVIGPKATTFRHGGNGGKENTLKLVPKEYITSMEVHWGKKKDHTRIFYVSFGTSAGNSVSGGSMTEERSLVTAPEGFQLGGLFGRDGKEIESLGAIWTRIEASALVTKAPPPVLQSPVPALTPPAEEPLVNQFGFTFDSIEAPAAAAASGTSSAESTRVPQAGTEPPPANSAAPSVSMENSVQLSIPFGGPHGTMFSDEPSATSGQTVASITIRADARVDGIALEIVAPTAATFDHGGTGGTANTLRLEQDEFIISMEVHWGPQSGRTRIFYLSFTTSAGNSVSGGTQTEDKSSVTAPEGFQLGGFFGRGGDEIDLLGAIWTSIEVVTAAPDTALAPDQEPGTVKPANTDALTTKAAIVLSKSFGGPHGKEFSDQHSASSGQTVSSLSIFADNRVDRVTLVVAKPTAKIFTHGGAGGTENKLKLGPGEHVISMEVHWDKKNGRTCISYLKLETSAGQSVFGGTQTEESEVVTAPEGYQLGGFFGRKGDSIDSLGALWTSLEAVDELTSSTSTDEDIQLSRVYGGPHGVAFSDISQLILGQTISSITLQGDERLDAVTLQVSKPAKLTWSHGGAGGIEKTLTLGPDEYIDLMEIHWGKKNDRTHVSFVSFATSKGKSLEIGTKTKDSAIETAPKGYRLSGFYGRAEGEVDQLGVIWTRISAKPLLLMDSVGFAWSGDTIRNWVGPTIGNSKDTACYRKSVPFISKDACPAGYTKEKSGCITQCPMAYPVECHLECIPRNDDCGLHIAQKVMSVAAVAFNAATAGLFGKVKTAYTTAKKFYLCAAAIISIIKSLVFYLRFTQTTAPQGDIEKLLAVAYQSDVVLIDLPVAVYSCLGLKVPPKLQWAGFALMIVENIVKQAIINGDTIISSAENVVDMLKNTSAVDTLDTDVTELQDFIDANTSCGFELKQLTDRVIFAVSDVRNATPQATVDDIRVTVNKSPIVLHDIPIVTNNCMKEILKNKTEVAAFETRDLLRKTMGVIIEQLIETSTTDMGHSVKEDDYMLEVSNLGLTVIGGMDPTGVVWMVSQFVQPICGPTSFIGEIDDGTLYDSLGLSVVGEAFVGTYGWWKKKGNGVVRLIFESTDTKDMTVVVYSGGDKFAEVDVAAGDTVTWDSTVLELADKTMYLERWRPGVAGLPGSGGGSLLLWIPRASEGGQLTMRVRVNNS